MKLTRPKLSALALATALVTPAWLASTATAQTAPQFECAAEAPSSEVAYESQFATVDGARMHYYEAGPADGPVVLLLHGLPVSAYFWRNVMPHLEDNHRVIALDHIGFGQSDRPEGIAFSLQDHIDYIGGFVEELGLEDVIVVGQDLGSVSGMIWAQQNAENVRAIAYVEGLIPPMVPVEAATTPEQLIGLWMAMRDPAMAQQMFVDGHMFINQVLPMSTSCPMPEETLATYAAPWADPESRPILYAVPAEVPIDGQPATYVPTIEAYVEWLTTSDVPKLLVHAEPGILMPAPLVEAALEMMPNATATNVGAGLHFLAESKPDELGQALSDWVDSLE